MKYFLLFVLLLARCVAATYYIDFATGSDAANGTSKATAWKHHPYMTGATGNSAGFTHAAGDQYIFKGAVTWDNTCWPMVITGSGTNTSTRDYYGVDLTWFAGGSWTRPVWDGGYVSLNSHNCRVAGNYVKIDNIEMKRKKCSDVSTAPALLSWDGIGGYVDNCYLHGWQTTSVVDDAYGGFVNSTATAALDLIMNNTEIENSENIGIQRSGVCVRMVAYIQGNCKIHDNSSGVLFCLVFNGSQLYNITGDPFDGVYHTNGIYIYPTAFGLSNNSTACYIKDSYLHDTFGGANMVYAQPADGNTVRLINTVCYGNMSDQTAVTIQTDQSNPYTGGTFSGYNNTIRVFDNTKPAFHVSTGFISLSVLNLNNNHVINAGSFTDSDGSNTVTYNNGGTNLSQSDATATAQGFDLAHLYAPQSTSVSTYNTGTDLSSIFTTDILGTARPQAGIFDIGAYERLSGGGDTTPPAPDPATISGTPTHTSTTITVTATTATDAGSPPVLYRFSNNAGSSWSSYQSSSSFTWTGLTPSTLYQVQVQAEDSATTPNVTGASGSTAVTTDAAGATVSPRGVNARYPHGQIQHH